MIVDDNLFQELLDRVAALEHKVAILEERLTPKEATRIAENTPVMSREENDRRRREADLRARLSMPSHFRSASSTSLPSTREREPSPLLDESQPERKGH
jgi:hypothetical protein